MSTSSSIVRLVRNLIDSGGYTHNDRLPPERVLCQKLGVTRSQLRPALAEMEADGLIWRHVGRGTFVGARPVLNLEEVVYLRDLVTPSQVIAVRNTIEPELARLAALHATAADLEQMKICVERGQNAPDWRGYEAWDHNLHHAIARASQNKLFLYLFETLNVVRRSKVWGQPRKTRRPVRNYSSFREHDAILAAILDRDPDRAGQAMLQHLETVYGNFLKTLGP